MFCTVSINSISSKLQFNWVFFLSNGSSKQNPPAEIPEMCLTLTCNFWPYGYFLLPCLCWLCIPRSKIFLHPYNLLSQWRNLHSASSKASGINQQNMILLPLLQYAVTYCCFLIGRLIMFLIANTNWLLHEGSMESIQPILWNVALQMQDIGVKPFSFGAYHGAFGYAIWVFGSGWDINYFCTAWPGK